MFHQLNRINASFSVSLRQMINRYMYSNFVANQILNQIAPVKLEDRIGVVNGVKGLFDSLARNGKNSKKRNVFVSDMSAGIKNSRVPRNGISDIMLYDQGSRAYQDWLTKYLLILYLHSTTVLGMLSDLFSSFFFAH